MTGRILPSVQYSYCLTTKNCFATIERCLSSIFSNNDRNIEVIVVDSISQDGTVEVLERYARRLRLISIECTRGKGRQVALENANGQYIIVLDSDEILHPAVRDFLSFYHTKFEGTAFLLMASGSDFRAHSSLFFIAPAQLIHAAGGWRDLQNCEDYDLWSRLAAMGKFRFTFGNPVVTHERTSFTLFAGIKDLYHHYMDCYRFGYRIEWRNSRALPIALLAYISYLCNLKTHPRFDNPAARIITRISKAEPFLVRLHRVYNCYVSFSEFDIGPKV